MRFLILFEAPYHLNQLNFIYNNTDKYKQKEKKMRKCLLAWTTTLVLCFLCNNCFSFVLNTKEYENARLQVTLGYLNVVFGCFIISISILIGVYLYLQVNFLMFKMHKYEFNQSRCRSFLFFLVMLCFMVLQLDQITGDMTNGYKKGTSLYMVDKKKTDFQKIEIIFDWFLQIPFFMTCFAIVKFKNTKDVLQGVSKLDYLHKVSQFQNYCRNLRRWQGTIIEDDEAEDFIINLKHVVNADGSVSIAC